MSSKLFLICVGLVVVGTAAPQSSAQLIYDISPELFRQEAYGYQQPATPPSAPIVANQGGAPMATGRGDGYSTGAALSGGMSTFGMSGANPSGRLTIYNPAVVASMSGIVDRAGQTVDWPPRGGPWGVGPAPPPPAESPLPGNELPGFVMPGEDALVDEAPMEDSPARTVGRMSAPYSASETTSSSRPRVARNYGASPLDPYLPPVLTDRRATSLSAPAEKRTESDDSQTTVPRTAGLPSVYQQQTAERKSRDDELPVPTDASTNRQSDSSNDRQLAPVYRQTQS